MVAPTSRLVFAAACLCLAACSSLLNLDDLQEVECLDGACSAAGGRRPHDAAGATSRGGAPSSSTGARAGATANAGASTANGGGDPTAPGGNAPHDGGSGGTGSSGGTATGGTLSTGPCPGGPTPAATWKEHWSGHEQDLSLRTYDDCVALYVDPAMSGVETDGMSSFLSRAWTYNLTTYGQLGTERLYVVIHGTYSLGRWGAFYEGNHDGHNVIDVGANDWDEADYDRLARALSKIVERTAVSGKHGSPAAAQWQTDGFAQIYTYDLYVGLAMAEHAARAWNAFEATSFDFPVPDSRWFSDFYYPTWRDHGKTSVLVDFFTLLEKYYPAPDGVMAAMNWGEYIHFASGAARHDLQAQATHAFGWNDQWQSELEQAREDFSAIDY